MKRQPKELVGKIRVVRVFLFFNLEFFYLVLDLYLSSLFLVFLLLYFCFESCNEKPKKNLFNRILKTKKDSFFFHFNMSIPELCKDLIHAVS